ncbi:MAG: lysoplasmalogenase family protein, partial [Tsuneonella troitsensis]
ALYLSNRRAQTSGSQKGAAVALLVGVPLLAWLLSRDPLAVIYAAALAAMAATAWLSRFSRYHVGIGALLFVASDLLIFARLGNALDYRIAEWLIWPLYYAGQFLIVTGVVRTLRTDHQA